LVIIFFFGLFEIYDVLKATSFTFQDFAS